MANELEAWYLSLDGGTVEGPFPWPEVERRIRAAGAERGAQVCLQGETVWRTFTAVRTPPPPPPAGTPEDLLRRAGAAAGDGIQRFVGDVRSLPFATLFPFADWLRERPWNLVWVRWFAFFAFFPLLVSLVLGRNAGLDRAAWAFGLYFAVIWGLLLSLCVKPGRISAVRVLQVGGFTAFLGIPLLLASQRLPIISNLYSAAMSANLIGQVTGFVLGVGILEEATKALPLYWLFVHRQQPASVREITFLGAVSGLAFGVSEAVSYSFNYAAWRNLAAINEGDYVVLQLLRFITLPLLHALWAGVVGYFIGLAATVRRRSLALVAVGLGAMALVHGLYDVFSGGWLGLALVIFSFLVFVGYTRSAELLVAKVREHDAAAPDRAAGTIPP